MATLSTHARQVPGVALGALLIAVGLGLTACKSGSCCPAGSSGKAASAPSLPSFRINAGATAPYTDPQGNAWLPDQGFAGGKTADRGTIEIAGTRTPDIYRTEHYGMTAFSQDLPNGAYVVKLHFAETFSRITDKGQRVFSVKVEDKEIKDLDVVARTGAPRTAWVETIPVEVTDGKLDITFTPGVQNPMINGIEILPR